MAFIRTPDAISIELIQKGAALRARRAVGVDGQHRRVVKAEATPARRRRAAGARAGAGSGLEHPLLRPARSE